MSSGNVRYDMPEVSGVKCHYNGLWGIGSGT
jgi:hypothetical protein